MDQSQWRRIVTPVRAAVTVMTAAAAGATGLVFTHWWNAWIGGGGAFIVLAVGTVVLIALPDNGH